MKKIALVLCFLFLVSVARAQVITFGPMLHCYFLKGKPTIVFGVEGAIYLGPYSLDLGFEGGKTHLLYYGEFQWCDAFKQTPFIKFNDRAMISGLSIGVFRRKDEDKPAIEGIQSTIWSCYYLGGDLRIRVAPNYLEGGIGAFGKLVIPFVNMGT